MQVTSVPSRTPLVPRAAPPPAPVQPRLSAFNADHAELSTRVSASPADDPDRAAKESVIRGMIRKSPDEHVTARVVDDLCAYSLLALRTVSDYGTKIEVYDFQAGDAVPEYLPTLGRPGYVGAYNTKANVLGFDRHNADTFTVLHEFMHALDEALDTPSRSPDWRGACQLASNTNRTVRNYAKWEPAEYMAESGTAYVIADANLPGLVDRGVREGALGLGDREYMQMCQNYSNERLRTIDPDGWKMVDDLLHGQLATAPRRAPRPAMTEPQWRDFLSAQKTGLGGKASDAGAAKSPP